MPVIYQELASTSGSYLKSSRRSSRRVAGCRSIVALAASTEMTLYEQGNMPAPARYIFSEGYRRLCLSHTVKEPHRQQHLVNSMGLISVSQSLITPPARPP